MEKQIKRIGILTSGGDAPGMNAVVRAVVRTGDQVHMNVNHFSAFSGHTQIVCHTRTIQAVSDF